MREAHDSWQNKKPKKEGHPSRSNGLFSVEISDLRRAMAGSRLQPSEPRRRASHRQHGRPAGITGERRAATAIKGPKLPLVWES
jgi:hypothetical protein